MTDATILIPTFRHASLVPFSVRSALDQSDVSVEVFVVGDGVEDQTRDALRSFENDSRFRFFDYPKSPRHGEPYRHEVLQEARGRIVCYLADDDLLLRNHAAEMCRLLEDADFAHGPATSVGTGGELRYHPFDVGQPALVEIARTADVSLGLTGCAHTLEAYRRLPNGWRTTPPGIYSDHYMWLQWFDLPGFRGVGGRRPTHLVFPDPEWAQLPEPERASALADWFDRSRAQGFAQELERMLGAATRSAAGNFFGHAQILERRLATAESALEEAESALQVAASELEATRTALEATTTELQTVRSALLRTEATLAAIESTRTWRLRGRLRSVSLLRALLARHRAAG
jgi:hypothetical protein